MAFSLFILGHCLLCHTGDVPFDGIVLGNAVDSPTYGFFRAISDGYPVVARALPWYLMCLSVSASRPIEASIISHSLFLCYLKLGQQISSYPFLIFFALPMRCSPVCVLPYECSAFWILLLIVPSSPQRYTRKQIFCIVLSTICLFFQWQHLSVDSKHHSSFMHSGT